MAASNAAPNNVNERVEKKSNETTKKTLVIIFIIRYTLLIACTDKEEKPMDLYGITRVEQKRHF